MSENKVMDLRLTEGSKELLDSGELIGKVAWGFVFGDKNTHGNHPFRDGLYIHTSRVEKVEKKKGKTFLHTMNSVYKLI